MIDYLHTRMGREEVEELGKEEGDKDTLPPPNPRLLHSPFLRICTRARVGEHHLRQGRYVSPRPELLMT